MDGLVLTRAIIPSRFTGEMFALAPSRDSVALLFHFSGILRAGLVFAPVTPETRWARIAGDLFVVVIRRCGTSRDRSTRCSESAARLP
jgi:hypothetical protein